MQWNALMTCVASEKPRSVAALCSDRARAAAWLDALLSLPRSLPLGTLSCAGMLASTLEVELGLDDVGSASGATSEPRVARLPAEHAAVAA